MILALAFPALISFLVYIAAALIILAALWYAITILAPGPIQNFLKVIVVVIGAIILAYLLLGFAGGGSPSLR